jgi:hypothetical protein
MSMKEAESVLDKPLPFTYHTQAFAKSLAAVAEEISPRQRVEVRSIFS